MANISIQNASSQVIRSPVYFLLIENKTIKKNQNVINDKFYLSNVQTDLKNENKLYFGFLKRECCLRRRKLIKILKIELKF